MQKIFDFKVSYTDLIVLDPSNKIFQDDWCDLDITNSSKVSGPMLKAVTKLFSDKLLISALCTFQLPTIWFDQWSRLSVSVSEKLCQQICINLETVETEHSFISKQLHEGSYWQILIAQISQPSGEIRHPYLNFYFCHGPCNLRIVDNFIPSICDQECCQFLFCLFSVVFCRLFVKVIVISSRKKHAFFRHGICPKINTLNFTLFQQF